MANRSELDTLRNIITLEEILKAIKRIDPTYPELMKEELKKRFGAELLQALPKHVATIELGEDFHLSRDNDQLKYVPIDRRETWDLLQIEKYGKSLSRTVGQTWKPIFGEKTP